MTTSQQALDRELTAWLKATRQLLLFRLARLNLLQRAELASRLRISRSRNKLRKLSEAKDQDEALLDSLKGRKRGKRDQLEAVYFSFARHGIFLEHGVGRGRPVDSSAANEHKKPWLSLVLPEAIDELADLLGERYAEIAIEELKLNIPGIIQTNTP